MKDNMSKMYKVDDKTVKTWNPFVGCKFNCAYCYARDIAKRSPCQLCREFKPHWHTERMLNRFKPFDNDIVFICSMGDISWATQNRFGDPHLCHQPPESSHPENDDPINKLFQIIRDNQDTTFMLQSKNPKCFQELQKGYPDNLILGTTIETDLPTNLISKAPCPLDRRVMFQEIKHNRKYITIEPILKFTTDFIEMIKLINPEFVYVGDDNHNHHLNEPTLAETQQLIKDIRSMGIEVREKTIRRAWYE